MELIIYVFVFASVAAVLSSSMASAVEFKLSRDMRGRLPQQKAKSGARMRFLLSFAIPFSRPLLEKLKLDTKIKNKLDAAHLNLKCEEFFSFKILFIAVLVGGLFLAIKPVEPWMILLVLFGGHLIPDIWMNNKISQRKYAIVRSLPETVDLLGLCVEAGLDFTTSIKWIIEKTPSNPMVEELVLVLEQIKWGKPRTQALKDMAKRLNVVEITSLVQTLVQSERMGTPVAQTFAILSEDTRLQRFHRGERIALKAPMKMLVPLIFCILPVIGIVVGGPILLQFMQGNLLKGM